MAHGFNVLHTRTSHPAMVLPHDYLQRFTSLLNYSHVLMSPDFLDFFFFCFARRHDASYMICCPFLQTLHYTRGIGIPFLLRNMYNNMAWVGAAVFPYYLAGLGYDTPSGIDIILGCKSVKTHCWACDTWVFSAFFF